MLSGVYASSLFAKCKYVCTVRGCAAVVLPEQRGALRFGLQAGATADYLTDAPYAADDAWDSSEVQLVLCSSTTVLWLPPAE